MTPRRYPLWDTFVLTVIAVAFVWCNLIIMACLWLGKPLELMPVSLSMVVGLLCFAAKSLDRYCWVREYLMAERKLAREYRALQACALVLQDRIDRDVLVYGTPLHKVGRERMKRTRAALRVVEGYRAQHKAT